MNKYRVRIKENESEALMKMSENDRSRRTVIEIEADGMHVDLLFHGTLAFVVGKSIVEVFPLAEIRRAWMVKDEPAPA